MPKETEYYIFSAKWTRSADRFLVWWQADNCGHTYFKEAIGTYPESKALKIHGSDNSFMIKKELVDPHFKEINDHGEKGHVITMHPEIIKAIGLKPITKTKFGVCFQPI